jgi:hypothetical protein
MTHNTRGALLTAILIAASILAAAGLVSAVLAVLGGAAGSFRASAVTHPWWFVYPEQQTPVAWYLVAETAFVAAIVTALIVSFRLLRIFRRTASSEAYFFALFLCALSVETLRPVVAIVGSGGLGTLISMLLTRALYAGRLFGAISLFVSTLYVLGVQYARVETPVTIALLLCLLFAYSLPLDSSEIVTTPAYRLGDEAAVAALFFCLYGFAAANALMARLRGQERGGLAQAGAVLLVSAGRDLLSFVTPPALSLSAMAAFAAGAILFASRTQRRLFLM